MNWMLISSSFLTLWIMIMIMTFFMNSFYHLNGK